MGVYDFFRGKCPSCDRNVDELFNKKTVTWEQCDDIQTKWFSYPIPGQCFRDFRPGYHLPGVLPFVYTPIGETVCCQTEIDAVCYGTLLCGYRVHVQEEPIENDIDRLQEMNIVPQNMPEHIMIKVQLMRTRDV
jgi:hypothetical protein